MEDSSILPFVKESPTNQLLLYSHGELKEEVDIDLETLQQFGNQVSGHSILYKIPTGRIMKRSNHHEIEVYELLQKHPSLAKHAPTFYGIAKINNLHIPTTTRDLANSKKSLRLEHFFIVLQDLTYDFKLPHVMDLKLGTTLYEPDASEEKKAKQEERAKQTTTSALGARVDGLKKSPSATKAAEKYHHECWAWPLENSFKIFLNDGAKIRRDICLIFIEELKEFKATLLKHAHQFNFLQSSILMVYESDPEAPVKAHLKLIDFDHAHIKPAKESTEDVGESGAVIGVTHIIEVLESLYKSSSTPNSNL